MPTCQTCKHLDQDTCKRFPRWEDVMPELHYCSEHKQARDRKAEKTPPDPRVNELLDYYINEFKRIFSAEPVVSYPKDAPAAKKLLSGRSLNECQWIVTEYLENPPQFYREKGLKAFRHIASAVGNGLVIDRPHVGGESIREYVDRQALSLAHDDPRRTHLFEYEMFLRTRNEPMPFTQWCEEFK